MADEVLIKILDAGKYFPCTYSVMYAFLMSDQLVYDVDNALPARKKIYSLLIKSHVRLNIIVA